MKKVKNIYLSLILVVCAFLVGFSFCGCRPKIDNEIITTVLPNVTGTYKEVTFELDELKPQGLVNAYLVNKNTYVVKSQNVWSNSTDDAVYIYSAIRAGRYLNIVAKKTENSTLTDEGLNKLQKELDFYKNKPMQFALNDVDEGKVSGYNFPKTLNTHYNFYSYISANVKLNKLNEKVTRSDIREINASASPSSGTPFSVNYESTILSSKVENGKHYVIVKNIPHNLNNAFYSPYCFSTIYVTFGETNELLDYKVLELYCSPNSTSYKNAKAIEAIFGFNNLEENKANEVVAHGTITAGSLWYALQAARDFNLNNTL